MIKTDYVALDGAILAALANGSMTFQAIATGDVKSAAHALEDASVRDRFGAAKPAWRFIGGRLQALRRAGRIRFVGPTTGWERT